MDITIDLVTLVAIVGGILSSAAAVVAVWVGLRQKRAYIVAEGQTMEKMSALLAEVAAHKIEIAQLKKDGSCTETELAVINTKLDGLVSAVEEIKENINHFLRPMEGRG